MNQAGLPTEVWARLRFETFERAAKGSALLALKAEDSMNRTRGTVDDTIKGEEEHFGQYD